MKPNKNKGVSKEKPFNFYFSHEQKKFHKKTTKQSNIGTTNSATSLINSYFITKKISKVCRAKWKIHYNAMKSH